MQEQGTLLLIFLTANQPSNVLVYYFLENLILIAKISRCCANQFISCKSQNKVVANKRWSTVLNLIFKFSDYMELLLLKIIFKYFEVDLNGYL